MEVSEFLNMKIDLDSTEPSKPKYFLRGDGEWSKLPSLETIYSLSLYPIFSRRNPGFVRKNVKQEPKGEVIVPPLDAPIRLKTLRRLDTIEPIVRIVITVLILAFALSGFLFLQPYQATLWLLFWIIAYPVALSFTRGEPLQGSNLVEIYIAGLKQVPVVGQIFAAFTGNTSPRPPHSPPENNDPTAGPKAGQPGAKKEP